MGYKCCLEGFIEPSKSLGEKYEPNEKFRGQKQTLFKKKGIWSEESMHVPGKVVDILKFGLRGDFVRKCSQ
jgi:hypothetical protein